MGVLKVKDRRNIEQIGILCQAGMHEVNKKELRSVLRSGSHPSATIRLSVAAGLSSMGSRQQVGRPFVGHWPSV